MYTCLLGKSNAEEEQQLAIAAAFHDLGIWQAHTFDYLDPSVQLAQAYLNQHQHQHFIDPVTAIIQNHHKLTKYPQNGLVENFRKADLIDLSFGLISFGLTRAQIKQCKKQYAYQGFQLHIFKKILMNFLLHPFRPLPMVKW